MTACLAHLFFSRNEGLALVSAEPVREVVDFESAVRIVNQTLSGFGQFRIMDVLPLYQLYLDEDPQGVGGDIEARPVYAFLVKGDSTPSEMGILKVNRYSHYFLVDMVTGELTTDVEIGGAG